MVTDSNINSRNSIIIILLALVALFRLIPVEYRLPNFTPMGAIALFSGAFIFQKRLSLALPLIILLVTDVILQLGGQQGFYLLMPWVYGTFFLITLLGRLIQKLQRGYSSIVFTMVAPLFSSFLFFFITNFGVWIMGTGHSGSSLVLCYVDAIPFYKGTVLGDVFYSVLLFLSFSVIRWRFPKHTVA